MSPQGAGGRDAPSLRSGRASLVRLAARVARAPLAALFGQPPGGLQCEAAWGDDAMDRLEPHARALELRAAAEPGRVVLPWRAEADGALSVAAVALPGESEGAPSLLVVGDAGGREWDREALDGLEEVARAAAALEARGERAPRDAAALPDAPPSGTWTWDLASDSITWSEEVNRILGLPQGRMEVGMNPILQLVHPDDRDAVRDAVRAAVRQRRDFDLAYRVVRPRGSVRWVRVRGHMVDTDAGGGASLIVGTCDDITEERRATGREAAPAAAPPRRTSLLAVVIETMREAARTELDANAIARRVAERAMALTRADGAAYGALVGDTIEYRAMTGVFEQERPVRVGLASLSGFAIEAGDVVRCDDTERDPRVDLVVTRRLGVRSMVVVPLIYRREPLGVLSVVATRPGAFTDDDLHVLQLMAGVTAPLLSHAAAFGATTALVAERTAALEALREAHETLAVVVDTAPLAIVTTDADFVVTGWNAAAERTLGHPAGEMLGQALPVGGAGDDDRETIWRPLRALGEAGASATWEARHQRADGAHVDVSVAAATLRAPEGEPRGVVAMIADVTERTRLEARVRQAQRMEAVGRLAGGLAHDFNNLLTVLQLQAELLLEELPADDTRRDAAREIQRQTDRATHLTQQLLAFSRKQLLQPRRIDLNAVVRDAEPLLARVAGEEIALALHLDADVDAVVADPHQLVQVLLDLAMNARDAMPHGGRLTIRTANAWLDAGYGDLHGAEVPEGAYAMLAVSDTGAGMPPETQARVFEPFFTTKEPGRGLGLGLSTVYGVVKQSGGFVWVYSEPGLGSTFKVYLPLGADAPPEPALPRERGGSETILLADDDDELRELARRHLAQLGYTVLAARDGEEALRLAVERPRPPDLLVTDLVMPRMSGATLAERLRALDPRTRVLFTTGYTEDDVATRGLLPPGQPMVTKPFSRRTLAAAVRRALD